MRPVIIDPYLRRPRSRKGRWRVRMASVCSAIGSRGPGGSPSRTVWVGTAPFAVSVPFLPFIPVSDSDGEAPFVTPPLTAF